MINYKSNIKILSCLFLLTLLPGCASSWSTGSIKQDPSQKTAAVQPSDPNKIIVTEGDITKRKYVSLGDITVTVNKTTVFNQTPTREDVNQRLKERAAKLGADAVILARYGEGGVSAFSWGSLEGKGRAIKYKK